MIILLYGAGGNGRVGVDLARLCNEIHPRWDEICFVDDTIGVDLFYGIKVYTFDEICKRFQPEEVEFSITLGDPLLRKKLYEKVKRHGYHFTTFCHPDAQISESATIKEGCIILNSSILSNVVIEENTIIFDGVLVGHDVTIGCHSLLNVRSFVGGYTTIGECSYIGPGSMLKDRVAVGKNSIIAMGATIFKDVPSEHVAIGNPARFMKKKEDSHLF